MSVGTFMTFAYGSNMLTTRLRERCPSAMPVNIAELRDYQLRWHKRSSDGSGKCEIVADGSTEVHVFGVLYRVANNERQALDSAEGLGHGYEEIDVRVVCDETEETAKAYRATDIDTMRRPYTWYRALVVAGAREHGLPKDYIDRLKLVVAKEDPDRERHDRNMRLIPEALK